MAQLNTYTNNMFATPANMDTALEQVDAIANGSDNPVAVHTAVRMVLNTAIRMHNAELSAVNKPLIELIDARVGAAVRELREDLYSQVQQAVEDYDHASMIESWLEDNLRAEEILSGRSFTINFD